MQNINDQKIYRIIDANFNRAKEGLRVSEDICRFVLDERKLTKEFKDIRHKLTDITVLLKLKKLVLARNIEGDVGKASTVHELKRKEVNDILYANTQRVKESIRVLEEFTKMINKRCSKDYKALRYKIYALEKRIIKKR